jgi:hypothetical protein
MRPKHIPTPEKMWELFEDIEHGANLHLDTLTAYLLKQVRLQLYH